MLAAAAVEVKQRGMVLLRLDLRVVAGAVEPGARLRRPAATSRRRARSRGRTGWRRAAWRRDRTHRTRPARVGRAAFRATGRTRPPCRRPACRRARSASSSSGVNSVAGSVAASDRDGRLDRARPAGRAPPVLRRRPAAGPARCARVRGRRSSTPHACTSSQSWSSASIQNTATVGTRCSAAVRSASRIVGDRLEQREQRAAEQPACCPVTIATLSGSRSRAAAASASGGAPRRRCCAMTMSAMRSRSRGWRCARAMASRHAAGSAGLPAKNSATRA